MTIISKITEYTNSRVQKIVNKGAIYFSSYKFRVRILLGFPCNKLSREVVLLHIIFRFDFIFL